MPIRDNSRYAAERTSKALDALASIHGGPESRLAAAWRELSFLDRHLDQFTKSGAELFQKLKRLMESKVSNADHVQGMNDYDKQQLADGIRELFHDTQRHYNGVD